MPSLSDYAGSQMSSISRPRTTQSVMSLESLKLQSRGRMLADQLLEKLAVPPTPSLSQMARGNRGDSSQTPSFLSHSRKAQEVLLRKSQSVPLPAVPTPPLSASSSFNLAQLNAKRLESLEELKRTPQVPPMPSLARHGSLDHLVPGSPLKSCGGSSATSHRALSEVLAARPPSVPESVVSFMTPTMSEVEGYVNAVQQVRYDLAEKVRRTQREGPRRRSFQDSRGSSKARAQPDVLKIKHDENVPPTPNVMPATPNLPPRYSQPQRKLQEVPEYEVSEPGLADEDNLMLQDLLSSGFHPKFVNAIMPPLEYAHLQPALVKPIVHQKSGEELMRRAHERHVSTLPAPSKPYQQRLSTPSLAEYVMRERERNPRPLTALSHATSRNLISHPFGHREGSNGRAAPNFPSIANGDYVPKNKRPFTQGGYARNEAQMQIDEYNNVLRALKDVYMQRGKKHLSIQFENLDNDKQGMLSRETMLKALEAFNPNLSNQALETLLQDFLVKTEGSEEEGGELVNYKALCDALHCDKLVFKEMESPIKQRVGPNPALPFGNPSTTNPPFAITSDSLANLIDVKGKYLSRYKRVYETFANMDPSGQGQIDYDGFMTVMRQLSETDPIIQLTDGDIRKLWRRNDRARTGLVDYRSFLTPKGDRGQALPDVPEFMKPKAARGSVQGPIWGWDSKPITLWN